MSIVLKMAWLFTNKYLSVFDEAVLLEVLLALLLLLGHEVGRVGRVALLAVAVSLANGRIRIEDIILPGDTGVQLFHKMNSVTYY